MQQARDRKWERNIDVGWFKWKGSVSAIQTAVCEQLMCLSCYTVGDPNAGGGEGKTSSGTPHPRVPTKHFRMFQTSLSFARTFMVILNINSAIVLSHIIIRHDSL